jgi:hypothetical protein
MFYLVDVSTALIDQNTVLRTILGKRRSRDQPE